MEMSARKRAAGAVRRALRVLKAFTMTLGDLSLRFDVEAMDGIADSGDLAEDMRDLLVEVGTAARASGTGFALILDEMQNLSKADLEVLIVGLHRAKQKALPLALVGGGLPLPPDPTGEAKSYAERGFEFRRIGALDEAAAAAALVEPTRDRAVRWDPGAVDRIIELTEGYPYFLQEYGREVWKVRHGEVIDAGQVEAQSRSCSPTWMTTSSASGSESSPTGSVVTCRRWRHLATGPREPAKSPPFWESARKSSQRSATA